MLKVRRIGTLVRALAMGTGVTAVAMVGAASMVAGCTDENAPATHVGRLGDPIKRTKSVERLIQMYNDKMTNDKQDRNGPTVKPLLDAIVQPLADLADKGDLDQKTQGKLLAMLADTRDPRAIKALVKAIDSYKPDDKRPDEFDTNMNDVVRNIGEMKATEASDALLNLFQQIHHSWPKAQNKSFTRTIQDAMIAINDPKWEGALVKLLEAPIKTLSTKELKTITDQMYWQTVSALILGNLKSAKAVPALMKVVLTPFKGPVGVTAISALIKIGKPSIDAGVKLLTGQDADMMKYAEDEFLRAIEDKGEKVDDKKKADAKKAYLDNSVIIVANIGRAECIDPMLAQIEKGDETSDAIIARELYKLPADARITQAFRKVYEATKLTASMPGGNAKEALTAAAGAFADAELANWVGQQALDAKGDEADVAPIQESALLMLMKLAGPVQMAVLEKLAAKEAGEGAQKAALGKGYEKELKIVREMVKECGDKADCYFKKLADPAAQKDSGFVGIKAAYMAAIFGGDSARAKFVALREGMTNAAVAFVIESLIDRLSPKGDKDAADKLQAIVDKAIASKDEQRASSVANLKTVVNRLRARTQ